MASYIPRVSSSDRYANWLVQESENQVTREQAADAIDSIINRAKEVWNQSGENLKTRYQICSRAGALIDRKFHVIVTRNKRSFFCMKSIFNNRYLLLPESYQITNLDSGLSISVPILPSGYNPREYFLGYDRPQTASVDHVAQVLDLKPDQDYKSKTEFTPMWTRIIPCKSIDYTEVYEEASKEGEILCFFEKFYHGSIQAFLLPYNAEKGKSYESEKGVYLHLIVKNKINVSDPLYIDGARVICSSILNPGCYVYQLVEKERTKISSFDCLVSKKYHELNDGYTYFQISVSKLDEMEFFLYMRFDEEAFLVKWKEFLSEYNEVIQNESLSNRDKCCRINEIAQKHMENSLSTI